MPFVVGERYTLGRRWSIEAARRYDATHETILIVAQLVNERHARFVNEATGLRFGGTSYHNDGGEWFTLIEAAQPEKYIIVVQEPDGRIRNLTGRDSDAATLYVAQAAIIRHSEVTPTNIYHLVPCRSIGSAQAGVYNAFD